MHDDRPQGNGTGTGAVSEHLPPCKDKIRTGGTIARRRIEIVSRGLDDALQGIGGDPDGGSSWVGLRVPALKNTSLTRYLFQLASFEVSDEQRARIIGLRQAWTLGYRQPGTTDPSAPPVVNEFMVEDPFFKLPDGNISWHLRKMQLHYPMDPRPGPIVPPLRNFSFETSDAPALLYQSAGFPAPSGFYTTLNRYTPPNRGRPWGDPIGGDLGTFYDLKTKWRDASDWSSLDIPVEGPCRVAFYCSVLQTEPTGAQGRRVLTMPSSAVTPPNTVLNFGNGLSAEQQFLQNFPDAIIWRVAGALVIELEDKKP